MKLTRKAAIALVLWASSMALAQSTPAQPATTPVCDSAASDYVIGPDDNLHIAVWKEADLSVTLPVRPDGKISLPLLDDVQAAGMTPIQLGQVLTEKYKKFVADPRITVVVAQINSKRIYLVGEVAHPGAMTLSPCMTVLQALSSAGLSQFANAKKIYVLRTVNGKQEKLPVPYPKLLKGELMDHNYALSAGDTIVVP